MLNARANYDRARLLLQQRRYADAERELHQTLAGDPNFAEAHALLGEVLLELRRLDDATAEAGLAVAQDPELEIGHFVMARVLLARNRHAEAEYAAVQALKLAPYPRTFGLLAAIRFEMRSWRGALEAADEGLAVDPEDSACLNLRAMALRQMGRHEEADRTLRGALESDPDDSFAHANRGWSELQQGRPREALVHFKESLRLDPTNEHARYGLVEAMKVRYLVYRILLAYFLWMNRLAQTAQFAIVVGGLIGYNLLRRFTVENPQYVWVTVPLMAAYVIFAYMTWLAAPLMNLALRLHPVGRYALSDEQRWTANVVGGLLLAALVTGAVMIALGAPALLPLAFAIAFAALPGSLIFRAESGWPRLVLAVMTVSVIVLFGTITLADAGLVSASTGEAMKRLRLPVLLGVLIGGQFIAAQRVKR